MMDDYGNTVVLDNGAYTAKVGLAAHEDPQIMPNCIMKAKAERRRAFIANQIDECCDASGLFYILPFQKGYLMNWEAQKTVWDYIFSKEGAGFTLEDRPLIITEPQMNFTSIQEGMLELLFEEYRCAGLYKTTTSDLAAYNYAAESEEGLSMDKLHCIVIDVGFSFTHVVPFFKGKRWINGIRRIDVGGKLLTNHLKEIISYRHLNMMEESYVVNQIKEDVCFVSQDFKEDMKVHEDPAKFTELMVDYVLPDYTTTRRGYIRKPESRVNDRDHQIVRLCNERFTVPELLFHPSDIGIKQVGIPEAIIDSLKDCPPNIYGALMRNILIIGGSSLFPGFVPRLKSQLRSLALDDYGISLIYPEDPVSYGWYGGKELACSENFKDLIFTRKEYDEKGFSGYKTKRKSLD